MGTRSTIALEFADKSVEQVYCHWDGYLEHNGMILLEYYSNPFILRDLIDLGERVIRCQEPQKNVQKKELYKINLFP